MLRNEDRVLTAEDRVVLFMRPGCHVCARVKKYLTEHSIPFEIRDVDSEPLTPRELWGIFNRKASRLRVPFTVLNDGEDVVLGYDPLRLEGVFLLGDHGGWQRSSAVYGKQTYDDYTEAALNSARWQIISAVSDSGADAVGTKFEVVTGGGALTLSANLHDKSADDAHRSYVSTERFGTPPGSSVTFELEMAVDNDRQVRFNRNAAFGVLSITDIAGGLSLGFHATNDTIFALHERRLLAGVTLPEERFSHRVVLDVDTDRGVQHRYAIRYQHDTGVAEWYVDGTCRYWAVTPRPIEGCSLAMGLFGARNSAPSTAQDAAVDTGISARWTPWFISSA